MRERLRAFYYPDFYVELPTLKKSILLYDEIHFADRPSFVFGGTYGSLGAASPMRQFEKSFRDEGVPIYVHEAPGGPVYGHLLATVEADLSDLNFMTRFQEGLRASPHFRNLHIAPGNYGDGETHETLFQKLAAIDLQQTRSALEVFNDAAVSHMDHKTPEGRLKILASDAAFCSVKMSLATDVGVREGFVPFSDASPYATLMSAKYNRIVSASSGVGRQLLATDLSLAIFDELVPAEKLSKINIGEVVGYRKESNDAREAFLEHLVALQAKLGEVPETGDYVSVINKIITTEVRPAAREFSNKLETIYEKLFGKIAGAAVAAVGSGIVWAGSSAAVHVLGDVTWEKLLALPIAAAAYVAPKAIDALVETRGVSRECAFSYLLDLEA
jgi:hypothetical protein